MHSVSPSPAHVSPERFNPLQAVSAITRKYRQKLHRLLSNYEKEITAALMPHYPPAYVLGEVDADLHRLGSVYRAHERAAYERAYKDHKNTQRRKQQKHSNI